MQSQFSPLSFSSLFTATCIAASPIAVAALPLVDDFNDGNDAGWTHFEPLAGFGSGGTWSFPSGGYRIQVPNPSPNPGALGAARAGSLRNDETITDAVLTWDVVDWNNGLPQVFGGIARVSNVGLGTTNAYGLVYGSGSFDILRFDGEAVGAVIDSSAITLDVSNDYRFVFTLTGSVLSGQVFDLAAPGTPISTITGSDSTYASGFTGLLVADASVTGTGTADATFDNFSLAVPEPSGAALALLGLAILIRRRR